MKLLSIAVLAVLSLNVNAGTKCTTDAQLLEQTTRTEAMFDLVNTSGGFASAPYGQCRRLKRLFKRVYLPACKEVVISDYTYHYAEDVLETECDYRNL